YSFQRFEERVRRARSMVGCPLSVGNNMKLCRWGLSVISIRMRLDKEIRPRRQPTMKAPLAFISVYPRRAACFKFVAFVDHANQSMRNGAGRADALSASSFAATGSLRQCAASGLQTSLLPGLLDRLAANANRRECHIRPANSFF